MVSITQVVPAIYHIDHPGGHASRCAVYLVAGDRGAIFETGPSSQVPGILEALESIGFQRERVAYIIPSHLHADHAGGAGSLARHLPWAKVVAHEQGAKHLVDPSRLIAGTRQAFGDHFEDEFGPIEPVPEAQLLTVKGGEALDLGSGTLEILYTPGHTLNSICAWEPSTKGLFLGDALSTFVGDRVVMPQSMPTQFDLEVTLESIDRLEARRPAILYPSHFGPVRDVALAFRSAREVVLAWRDIALAGLKAGDPAEAIVDRFIATMGGSLPYDPAATRHMLSLCVTGYSLYFRRKRLL